MKKLKQRLHQFSVLSKYTYYKLYCKVKKINHKDVWLISERGTEARDNGYAFYKYLLKNHPEVNFKYVITKDSPDLKKFKDKNRLVYYGSKEHYILFLTAGYHLSTHIMGCSPEFRSFTKLSSRGFIKTPAKRIFLNHGIELSNTNYISSKNLNLDLFVCTAKPQYEHNLQALNFKDGVVQYLGMPRYDYLKNSPKNQIIIMPTWRSWLFYCKNTEEFKATNYFKYWNALLKSPKLQQILEKNNLKLIFYPHYEIQPYLQAFSDNNYHQNIVIASLKTHDIQTLFNESRLMITDYSSVMFDFAYLKKPLIYYQFDYSDFIEKHYGKGYFSFKNDGFGPIETEPDQVIKQLEHYVKNSYKIEQKYAKNRNRFFTLPAGNNCERIYQYITSKLC